MRFGKTPRFDDHLAALSRYARALTRNPDAAEDLVQDTLVAAYARSESYRDDQPLRTWLFAILHNRFISDMRHQRVSRDALAGLAPLAPTADAPAQEAALCLEQVSRALDALPSEQNAAIHLIAVEGLSYAEAAAALNIPVGTLMSRLSRARARLRSATEGESGADRDRPPLRLRIVKG